MSERGVTLRALKNRQRVTCRDLINEEGGEFSGVRSVWLLPAFRVEPPCEWCGETKAYGLRYTDRRWKVECPHGHIRLILPSGVIQQDYDIGYPSCIEGGVEYDPMNPSDKEYDAMVETMRRRDANELRWSGRAG